MIGRSRVERVAAAGALVHAVLLVLVVLPSPGRLGPLLAQDAVLAQQASAVLISAKHNGYVHHTILNLAHAYPAHSTVEVT